MMENQLFTWDNWDVLDVMVFYFYNCVFTDGTEATGVTMDYGKGEMIVEYLNGKKETFNLKLSMEK